MWKRSPTSKKSLPSVSPSFSSTTRTKIPTPIWREVAWGLRSKGVRQWVAMSYYEETGKGMGSETWSQVQAVLEAKALRNKEEVELQNRIGIHQGAFLYDLGDDRAIKVTPEGWEIILAPILFRRYAHQQKQVDPIRGGDAWEVLPVLQHARR